MPKNKWFDKELMLKVDKEMRRVEKKGATKIRKDAKFNVSSNLNSKTGNLERRIGTRKSKFPNGGRVVRSAAPHSVLIEFGHKIKSRGKAKGREPKDLGYKYKAPKYKKSTSGRARAFPFMGPAVYKNYGLIMKDFRDIYK